MKTSKAIDEIKAAGHDISDEYSRAECIGFLNTAIHEVSGLLVAANSPMMVREILIHDGESVPKHYVRSAGQYPMRITGQTVQFIDPMMNEIRFRYFATIPPLDGETGDLPFPHDALNKYVLKVAILHALNRNEYDVSQDKALADEFRSILTGAVTGNG
jgi:hypothetical protein